MIIEWVKTLGPILISWPIVGLIAILVFRKDIQRVKFGGLELERVKEKVDQQASEINAILIALKGILMKHEMDPLERLNDPKNEEVPIRWEPELYGYLHRLDGLNFIQPHKDKGLKYGLYDIEEDHRHEGSLPYQERPEFDLRKYVYITGEGKKYLNILNNILRKADEQIHEGVYSG